MNKYIFTFIFFFVSLKNIFPQNINDSIFESVLSESEIIFADSINKLNEINESINMSRNLYNIGLEFMQNKEFNEAINSFSKAINIDSTFALAYFNRAKCYETLNNELALVDFKTSFILDSSNYTSLYSIANIQSKFDNELAINTYKQILLLNSNESKAYFEIGVLLFMQSKFDLAIESFSSALNINRDARYLNDRGSCYRKLAKYDLAIKDYLEAIKIDPSLVFVYNNLASTYRKSGENEKALTYYSYAISYDDSYFIAYNNRSSLYFDMNQIENAVADVNKSISINSLYAPAFNNRGVIYHHKKMYVEALANFDIALELNTNYAKAYLNRGITKQMNRDEDGACYDWKKAYDLGIKLADKYFVNDCNE